MQNGLFRKERKLCTKPWEKTEIKSNKSVKKCDTNKQTNKQNVQYWGRISRADIAPVFCGCSARRKIIFSNGSEITCFDFYLNPVTKLTFTFDLPRHKETQPSTSISVSHKIVSHFLREVAVKLQQKMHWTTWYIRETCEGILRADLLLAIQIKLKLLASQQVLKVYALECNKGFVSWL